MRIFYKAYPYNHSFPNHSIYSAVTLHPLPMKLLPIYYVIAAVLVPALMFLVPIVKSFFTDYTLPIPIEILVAIAISFVMFFFIFTFHLHYTSEECNRKDVPDAVVAGIKTMVLVFLWVFCLDYYKWILSPFIGVFYFSSAPFIAMYKAILVYALVFILLTYTSFTSIKNSCKASISEMKQKYISENNALDKE